VAAAGLAARCLTGGGTGTCLGKGALHLATNAAAGTSQLTIAMATTAAYARGAACAHQFGGTAACTGGGSDEIAPWRQAGGGVTALLQVVATACHGACANASVWCHVTQAGKGVLEYGYLFSG